MPRTRVRKTDVDDPSWLVPYLREPRYSQSLERGMAILRCFTPKRPVLGIANIADELEMTRSTTHRYVITLLELGYLKQDASRKYRLGLRVVDLGMAALSALPLQEHAAAHLRELASRSGCSISLAVLDHGEVLLVDHVSSRHRGERDDLRVGLRLPLALTAPGKLLLAMLAETERDTFVKGIKLKKAGPNAITTKRELREELEAIKEDGLALDDEEHVVERVALAAPVRDQGKETVAAVVLTAPTSRISAGDLTAGLAPHVIVAANQISESLGFRREDAEEPVTA